MAWRGREVVDGRGLMLVWRGKCCRILSLARKDDRTPLEPLPLPRVEIMAQKSSS